MKWLIVHPGPDFSVADVYAGWREALTDLGERVQVYNMADRLTFFDSVAIETGVRDSEGRPEFRKAVTHDEAIKLAAAEGLVAAAMWHLPDVALIVSGFFVPAEVMALMRARGIKVVFLCTEAPYEDGRQLHKAACADVTLLNDPVSLDRYRDVCPVAEYVPHAYRPSVHYPASLPKEYDLAFSGTGYTSRQQFFTGMGLRGLKVALAGNWVATPKRSQLRKYLVHDVNDCLDNELTADLYRVSKAGINFYRREHDADATADGWSVGPREIEMAACGLWFLRDPRPESDELFPRLPTFDSAQQAGEMLRWALKNDTLREAGAQAARDAVKDRTFRANAEMLLRILDRQPVTI